MAAVRSLHGIIVEALPDVDVMIPYQMPTYRVGEYRLYVGAWKNWVALHGWEQGAEAGFATRHPDMVTGKGTIQLKPATASMVTDDELHELVVVALEGGAVRRGRSGRRWPHLRCAR